MSQGAPPQAEDLAGLVEAESRRAGLRLRSVELEPLAAYLSELEIWRARMNLTGRLTRHDLAAHTVESLLARSLISDNTEVIDVGSGSGFPALPLAIVRPDSRFTMVEVRSRKAAFLRHVVRKLELRNADVVIGDVARIPYGPWKTATSRAVADPDKLLQSAPALRSVDVLLAWTTDPERLARRLADAGFVPDATVPVPGSDRRLIARFRRS